MSQNRWVLVGVVILALAAGGYVLWRGMPAKAPVVSTESKMSYGSTELGISLLFPDTYTYTIGADVYNDADARIIAFVEKDLAAQTPQGGEGPPGIALIVVDNPDGKTLEQWVRSETISNFNLSADKTLTATTIGGELAFSYRFSGLYENDAYAVMHGEKVYFFFGGWMNESDSLRADLQAMVASVNFI